MVKLKKIKPGKGPLESMHPTHHTVDSVSIEKTETDRILSDHPKERAYGCGSECCFNSIFTYYVGCFRKYAHLGGRASRMEFFSFFVINFFVTLILGWLGWNFPPLMVLSLAYGIFAFTPFWAVATRRFHDSGHSGWLLLLAVILFFGGSLGAFFFKYQPGGLLPMYGLVALMLLAFAYIVFILFKKGDALPNEYDTVPSHPYRDGAILILIICLYYAFLFYGAYQVSRFQNQDPGVLSIPFNRVQINDDTVPNNGSARFMLEDFFDMDDDMNNTVTIIEEADEEGEETPSLPAAGVRADGTGSTMEKADLNENADIPVKDVPLVPAEEMAAQTSVSNS